jgi:predicted esterase
MDKAMIEAVGRALAKQEGYHYDPLPYDERAIAAIEAMEPFIEALLRERERDIDAAIACGPR